MVECRVVLYALFILVLVVLPFVMNKNEYINITALTENWRSSDGNIPTFIGRVQPFKNENHLSKAVKVKLSSLILVTERWARS